MKGVNRMKCAYNDGLSVAYTGSVQILKGSEVNVFIKESRLTDDMKVDLEMALFRNSCSDMRKIADTLTKTFGNKACVH